jgi:phytanoyl-CoA hydroxylase
MKPTYAISGPIQEKLEIPVGVSADDDLYAALDPVGQKRYYEENGYVILRNMIDPAACDEAVAAFRSTVKSYPGLMYRQTASGLAEPHRFTESGFMINSILNPHDLNSRQFGQFRRLLLAKFTSTALRLAVRNLFQQNPVLVQTMYFEGNPATWAHQDTYYLDANPLGSLAAAWIALEDIHPGAGRFYVYPTSHKLSLPKNTRDLNFSKNHDNYKEFIKTTIKQEGFECRAPALAKGDILIWNSFTIHGSLATTEPSRSRNSLTAHYIPAQSPFLQFQVNPIRLKTTNHNGILVHHPKDQDHLKNRLVLGAERLFPSTYRFARSYAIRHLTK